MTGPLQLSLFYCFLDSWNSQGLPYSFIETVITFNLFPCSIVSIRMKSSLFAPYAAPACTNVKWYAIYNQSRYFNRISPPTQLPCTQTAYLPRVCKANVIIISTPHIERKQTFLILNPLRGTNPVHVVTTFTAQIHFSLFAFNHSYVISDSVINSKSVNNLINAHYIINY